MALRIWKAGSLIGVFLLALGITAGYFDIATRFAFPFISDHFEIFLLGIIIGLLCAFICLIGWATHLRRSARGRLAVVVFVAPWLAGAAGYPIAGTNIHGPAALLMYIVGPTSVLLAFVLLIMAAAGGASD
jgi:hypothetical protein